MPPYKDMLKIKLTHLLLCIFITIDIIILSNKPPYKKIKHQDQMDFTSEIQGWFTYGIQSTWCNIYNINKIKESKITDGYLSKYKKAFAKIHSHS